MRHSSESDCGYARDTIRKGVVCSSIDLLGRLVLKNADEKWPRVREQLLQLCNTTIIAAAVQHCQQLLLQLCNTVNN
jgi:hypothetical protein